MKKTKGIKSKKIINISANICVNMIQKHSVVLLLLSTILISVLVFWNYLVQNNIYLFTDIASDSYFQTYPYFYSIIHYIRENGTIPEFMFTVGLGEKVKTLMIFPYNMILLLFNEREFVYVLPYIQIVKIILAAIVYYAFMREKNMSRYTSVIMAISYAFCGHMIVRNMWYTYSIEVVLVAFILWGFELFYNNKNRIILPLAMFITLNTLSSYYMLIYIAIIIGYTVFRYFLSGIDNRRDVAFRKKYILEYTIVYAIVIVITIFFQKDELISTFFSTRFNDGLDNKTVNMAEYPIIAPIKEIMRAYISAFSMRISVKNNVYNGDWSQLDDPTYYCSAITMLFVCAGIKLEKLITFGNKKNRTSEDIESKNKDIASVVLEIASYVLIIVYTISPRLRYYANGMSSKSYKLSSFWIVIVMMYWAAIELEEWVRYGKVDKKKWRIMTGVNIVLLTISALLIGNDINRKVLVEIIIMLILIMLLMTSNKISQKIKLTGVFVVLIIQTVIGTDKIISDRGTITKEHYEARVDYNDYTRECIDYIKSIDNSPFYRIDKLYNAPYINDSMVEEYYGTKTYIGGTDFNSDLREFVISQGAQFYRYGYMYGFYGITETNTYVGVKYLLSKTDKIPYYGYTLIKQIEDIYIFENDNALSLGFCYNDYITEREYDELSIEDRRKIILNKAVIEDNIIGQDSVLDLNKENSDVQYDIIEKSDVETEVAITGEEQRLVNLTQKYIVNKADDDTLLKLEFYVKNDSEEQGWLRYVSDGVVKTTEIITHNEDSHYILELNESNIEYFWVELLGYDRGEAVEGTVKCNLINKDNRYEEYMNSITELQKQEYNIEYFSDEYISGNIDVEQDGIFCLTIPYNENWEIYVDGNKVDKMKLNKAFIGCKIKKGFHKIEVRYIKKSLIKNNG